MIGGQSRRMGGGIKSFEVFNNKSILQRILDRVKPQIKKILINSNIDDERLLKYKYKIIKDLKPGYMGPLAGIHSGMNWVLNNEPKIEWLITLPGDTPFIPEDLISRLNNKMTSHSKIILVQSNYKTHPIIGAWHISLFDSLNYQLDNGIRKILSWAELHDTNFVNFPFKKYDPFFNINTRKDMEMASGIEKIYF